MEESDVMSPEAAPQSPNQESLEVSPSMKVFSKEEALKASIEYFNGDELAASTFLAKYALTDNDGNLREKTPDDMHRRLAREFARIESKYPNPMSEEEIYALMKDFGEVVPQGSPMSAVGNDYQVQSSSNCFVLSSPRDSYGGISTTDQEEAQIMKRRGGCGFDISTIRPKGMPTANAAKTTDGIGVFMERFSNTCREVAQGGRRGALLLSISVHHPEIRTFIQIKKDKKKVTGANISIRLTDEFLEAVEAEGSLQLRFPVEKNVPHIFETSVSATEIWREIIEAAWASAEPGLLFWDNALKNTPSDCYESEGFNSISTNPCGEIVLSKNDSCRLLLANLAGFVENAFSEAARFNFHRFDESVIKSQRLMDDLIDLEIEQVDKIITKVISDPEPEEVKAIELNLWRNVRDRAVQGRRTGLGVTAVGDMLAMLGMTYGSDESIAFVEEVYKQLGTNAYLSSCRLAKERGAFPVFSHAKEAGHPFISRILEAGTDELRELYQQYGRRNIALTTTAPAGTVSLMTQTTSGIEPAYLLEYKRRKKIMGNNDATADFVDAMGDRWQEFKVRHHGLQQWVEITGNEDITQSPYWNSTSDKIDWVQRVKLQAAAQKWICHSISSTVNIPNHTTVDTVKDIYMAGWKSGCKGITVYRDGCRDGVLLSMDDKSKTTASSTLDAPKRPKELPCEIHKANVKGESWVILVGLFEGRPYEIFGGLAKYVDIPAKYETGVLIKKSRKTSNSIYDLQFGEKGAEVMVKDVVSTFENELYGSLTRSVSLSLRHGVPIQYVVEQLQKDKHSDLFSLSAVIARTLKKYIKDGTVAGGGKCPECTSTLIYKEGCASCASCGYSKCS